MIRTLRKKFILINMLLVFLVLALVFTALCVTSYKRMQWGSMRILEMTLTRNNDHWPPSFEVGKTPPPEYMRDPVFVVRIGQNGGTALLSADNISISEGTLAQIVAAAARSGTDSGILREYNLRYLRAARPDGTKIAFIDLSSNNAAMRHTILASVLLCVTALAAFFVISLFLSKWALHPVEQAWMRQKQFVADASHELKTPLTVILANTGILKSNRADTIDRQIGWVENTEAEAKRMKQLVDSLLFLAKADDGRLPLVYHEFNLSDVILGAALAFESVAYDRGVSIGTDCIAQDIRMSGDEAQLGQLAGLLLDNAVKYAEEGGAVSLSLAVKQEKAVFSVHNTGSHLDAEDLEHMFDRFYRADKSRSNEGYGLGLSIAKSIVESHGGKISAESDPEKGTAFTVVLPL